jgi:hypothetical protein
MIIVQLKGGLGNQLFQYAAGLSLGQHHHVPVKVDINELKEADKKIKTQRSYELDKLIEPPLVASEEEIEFFTRQNILNKYLDKLRSSHRRLIYNEKKFQFDKNFFSAGPTTYLKGYRQSEKYFISIEEKIRFEFQLKPALLQNVQAYVGQLASEESVSIHIRRGDYANALVQNYHGTLNEEYYQAAINTISAAIKNTSFYIFSDDIKWIKDKLKFSRPVEFISGSVTKTPYEDFYLMSRCKHNIIANSSFSWWAAWLNSNPGKIVIAPKKWFNNAPYDTRDLIPEGWLKL